jgi:hypothetical protein
VSVSGVATSANQTNAAQKTQVVDGAGVVVGTNYGAAGNAHRVASQIGNTTGQADFNTGNASPQTLRVVPVSDIAQRVESFVLNASGTSSALNATPIPSTDVSDFQCLKFQVTGTSTQTLTMQGSADAATWLITNFKDVSATNSAQQTTIANTGGESIFQMPITTKFIRLISTAFTSGTMTVTYTLTSMPCSQDMGIRTVTVNGSVTTTLTSGTLTSQATTADIAAAARTTTFTSANINPQQGSQSISVSINVTAVSGTTPTMDCVLQFSGDTATTYEDAYHWPRITAAGNYQSAFIRPWGNRMRYICTIAGTTPSFTFGATRVDAQNGAQVGHAFFNRTITGNTANSATPAWFVEGCQNHNFTTVLTGCTTFPTFVADFSEDGTNWAVASISLPITANGAAISSPTTMMSKFARIRTATAGTTCTTTYVAYRCKGP